MELRIWLNKGYKNIKPTDTVKTFRAVTSFSVENCLRDCLFKAQGGYYKLNMDGTLTLVCGTLDGLTFEQLYKILKD